MSAVVCVPASTCLPLYICVCVFISGHYVARRLSSQQAFKPETARLCRDDIVLSAAAVCLVCQVFGH